MPDTPEFDHLLYVREDAGRELPGSGVVLSPHVPMPLFGKGAIDGELAVILVARGDCAYCDASGNQGSADQNVSKPEPQAVPEKAAEPQAAPDLRADGEPDGVEAPPQPSTSEGAPDA